MIKQTYERKNKTKASTKQVLLAANKEIETQVTGSVPHLSSNPIRGHRSVQKRGSSLLCFYFRCWSRVVALFQLPKCNRPAISLMVSVVARPRPSLHCGSHHLNLFKEIAFASLDAIGGGGMSGPGQSLPGEPELAFGLGAALASITKRVLLAISAQSALLGRQGAPLYVALRGAERHSECDGQFDRLLCCGPHPTAPSVLF